MVSEERQTITKIHATVNKEPKMSVVTFRVFQAICLGVFAMGLSMMAGDYTDFVQFPISALSITTTIFGLLGAVITEIFARQADKW